MIAGILRPMRGSNNLHFMDVSASDDDIVYEVPVF